MRIYWRWKFRHDCCQRSKLLMIWYKACILNNTESTESSVRVEHYWIEQEDFKKCSNFVEKKRKMHVGNDNSNSVFSSTYSRNWHRKNYLLKSLQRSCLFFFQDLWTNIILTVKAQILNTSVKAKGPH